MKTDKEIAGEKLSAVEQRVYDGSRSEKTVELLRIISCLELKIFHPGLLSLSKKPHEKGAMTVGTSKQFVQYLIRFLREIGENPKLLFEPQPGSFFKYDDNIAPVFGKGHSEFLGRVLGADVPTEFQLECAKTIAKECANYTEEYAKQILSDQEVLPSFESRCAENIPAERLAGLWHYLWELCPSQHPVTTEAKVLLRKNGIYKWFMSLSKEEQKRLWKIAKKSGKILCDKKKKKFGEIKKIQLEKLEESVEKTKKRAIKQDLEHNRIEERWNNIEKFSTFEELESKFESATFTQRQALLKEQTWMLRHDVDVQYPNKMLPLTRKKESIPENEMLQNIKKVFEIKTGRPATLKPKALVGLIEAAAGTS